jgi:hypothetical protein
LFGIDRYGESRRVLWICHCGDFECGCVSTEITVSDDYVRWSKFVYHREGKNFELNMGFIDFLPESHMAALLAAQSVQ